MPFSREDLVNREFKCWRVVRPAGRQGPSRLWLCECPSGHTEVISTSNLRRHDVKKVCPKCATTGCWSDLARRTFGLLQVEERAGERKCNDGGPYRYWRCRCKCGRVVEVRAGHLKSGAIQSCGVCQVPERMAKLREIRRAKRRLLPPGEAAFRQLLRRYQQNASKRGLAWELTREQAKTMFQSSCFYCGAPPERLQRVCPDGSPFTFNGLDRRDNGRGYLLENTVPCCFPCNESKNDHQEADFIAWIGRAYRHLVARGRLQPGGARPVFGPQPGEFSAVYDDFANAVLG